MEMLSAICVFQLVAMLPTIMGKPFNATKIEVENVCTKKYFEETYLRDEKLALDAKVFAEKCSNSRSHQCAERILLEENTLQATFGITTEGKDALHVYYEKSFSKQFFQDCWGAAIQINAKNYSQTFYFMEYEHIPEVSVLVKPGEEIQISSIYLPTGHLISMTIRTPGSQCEKDALEELYDTASYENLTHCSQFELLFMLRVTEEICNQKVSNNKSVADAINSLKKVCVQKMRNQDFAEFSNITKTVEIHSGIHALLLVFSTLTAPFVIVLALIIYFKVWRNKQYKTHKFLSESWLLENHSKIKDENNLISDVAQNNKYISVLIINRPGCDLLDKAMINLTFVLKSFGIDVKLAALEQSQIDSDGGIASFMQKNIETCDYILIACSYSNPEDFENQKPYEFAVRVINGLAYHNNSCSRFIPIYLNDYSEIAHLIPSFLKVTITAGFKIPEDVLKLVKIISNKTFTSEKGLKNEFFINELRESVIKYLSKNHEKCSFKAGCPKGKLIRQSVSNLSFSAIDSRYSSLKSIIESSSSLDIRNNTVDEIQNV
ncbi:uncharacterized protein LOC100205133 isoform X1 [Hydra vulgaris]|uniref:uncharacterized protein LOC100205133 isoform X1 n=1 Tax=Hydra vulgaris TaxID=6087 RepID=UPI000640F674|nr:uncharacterized protein LOC100205133 [Hydra vulgaris]